MKLFISLFTFLFFAVAVESFAQHKGAIKTRLPTTEFIHICNISPLDSSFSDEYLYKNSRLISVKSNQKIYNLINSIFSKYPSALRSRIKVMENNFQYGVTTFYSGAGFDAPIVITINPAKIRSSIKDKTMSDLSIAYLVSHALSHILLNDFLPGRNNLYRHYLSELSADKTAGRIITSLYTKSINSDFFLLALPKIICSSTTRLSEPPMTARILSAKCGLLEYALPGTKESAIGGIDELPPDERKKALEDIFKDDQYKSLGWAVDVDAGFELTTRTMWMKLFNAQDSSIGYIGKKIRFKMPSGKYEDDYGDDDDDYDDDNDDYGGDENQLIQVEQQRYIDSADFYYKINSFQNRKLTYVRSNSVRYPTILTYEQSSNGKSRLAFYAGPKTRRYISIWENGDYFSGEATNNVESKNVTYQGEYVSGGVIKKGRFDYEFKPIR